MRDQNDIALVERLRGQDEQALAELSSWPRQEYQLALPTAQSRDAEEVARMGC